jgi:multisubunit Na+/H+ antiporter MnhE subunit
MKAWQLVLVWASFTALWLVFVFQTSRSEVLVGLACSALATFALRTVLSSVPLCFQPSLRWLAQAWRLPGMIVEDLWVLLKVLGRHLLRKPSQSILEITDFTATGDNSRESAQRALATLFLSVSPNSIVIDIDRSNRQLLFHQLQRSPLSVLVSKLQK